MLTISMNIGKLTLREREGIQYTENTIYMNVGRPLQALHGYCIQQSVNIAIDRERKLHHQFIRQEILLWKCRNNKSKRREVLICFDFVRFAFFPPVFPLYFVGINCFLSSNSAYLAVSPHRSSHIMHTRNPTWRTLIMAPVTNECYYQ